MININNSYKAFAVVIACVKIVFCLVTCVNNKLWLLEFYPHKGEKSLSEEMEIVSTDLAIALWRDEINWIESPRKSEGCIVVSLRNIHEFLKRHSSVRRATLRVS